MKNSLEIINEQEVLGKEFKVYGTFENPLYVTEDGRIFRVNKHSKYYKNGKDGDLIELPQYKWGDYLIVNYRGKSHRVNRVVATCYIPNPNNLPVVNHIDGNKLNNHYSNLEWCTQQYNTQHAYDNGFAKSKGKSLPKEKNPMYGKHHTQEAKKKISESKKGSIPHNKSTPLDYKTKSCTIGQFKRVINETHYQLEQFDKILDKRGKNNKYFFIFKEESK